MTGGEIVELTASALAAAIRGGEVSSREVVRAHLDRIAAVDGAINAVVALDGEAALARASEADDALARGTRWGPLHGVPFTAKDNLAVTAMPLAIGVPERRDVVAGTDATAVARLKASGGIVLGKTNCPAWGAGIETVNDLHGRTSNPYDLSRTPGGSSGGEAAIIAAGGSPCGLGTDSGGSVRIPAHCCGLASLKPTAGLVPVTGVIDDAGQIGAMSDPRTQVGVLARSVRDVALVLGLVAGPDGRDAGVSPVTPRTPPSRDVAGLRVAVSYGRDPLAATDDTVVTVADAARALQAAGAQVQEADPPAGGHELTLEVWRSYGGTMRTGEYYDLLRRWDAYRTEMLSFGARHDLILSPAFPSPARPHGRMHPPGEAEPTGYTTPHSLTGWPAATVRCGTSADGLPIAVQVVGRPWEDALVLAVAQRLEDELGGFSPPPPIA